MIRGIGVDAVELARIEQVWRRQPRFVERILTPAERDYCLRAPRLTIPRLAGRWAAKEAIAKAVGRPLRWQEVEILPDEWGAPRVKLYGYSAQVAGAGRWLVSITHTRTDALALALWIVEP
ncbi:MAG: holo-ACP synthase [Fimbriimonadales bacterium]|nr:holo-ACP synthase [Fimbriimonadales bacterium]